MEETNRTLSSQELQALLDLVTKKGEEATVSAPELEQDVLLYDFKRPERISKEQVRTFSMLHETFARNFASSLTTLIRNVVEVEVKLVEQPTYSEFVMALPNPTCLNLFAVPRLGGNIYVEVSYSILFPLIDRLLGGSGAIVTIPTRSLTDVEWQVSNTILSRALDYLKESWKVLGEFDFTVVAQESNPNLLPGLQPNEPVIRVCFEIRLKNHVGFLNLGFPYITLESVLPSLTSRTWFTTIKEMSPQESRNLLDHLLEVQVMTTCEARSTPLPLRDFLELKKGDVIILHQNKDQPFVLKVNQQVLFEAEVVQLHSKKAARIKNRLLNVN